VLRAKFPPQQAQSSLPTDHPTLMGALKGAWEGRKAIGDALSGYQTENLPMTMGTAFGAVGEAAGPAAGVGMAALGGSAGRSMQRLLEPEKYGNQPSSKAAKDITLSGLEQGAYQLGGLGIAKVASWLRPASRAARLSSGAGIEAGESAVANLIPDFDKKVAASGGQSPKTIGEFEKVVNDTNGRLQDEYGKALFPIANQPVAANAVGNAIRAKITPAMKLTAEGRATANSLRKRAAEFEKEGWTIGTLDEQRSMLAKKIRGYRNAAPSSAAAKIKLDAELAADQAANESLNGMLYSTADQQAGKPAGYFQDLKRKQSILYDVADNVQKEKDRLIAQSAKSKGALLREKLHIGEYLHPMRASAGATLGASPTKFIDPLATANQKIGMGFPSQLTQGERTAREAISGALGSQTINSLPIRYLFMPDMEPEASHTPSLPTGHAIQSLLQ